MTGIPALHWPGAIVASLLIGAACTSTSSHTAAPTTTATSAPTTTATTSTTPAPVTTPLPPVRPVSWKACTGLDGPEGFDCATLEVPLDYADPNGRKIGIALDHKAATGTKFGSLLLNPGGPGASGVDFLESMAARLSDSVQAHFDLVGFDPRGVGRSSPVRCGTGPQLDQYNHLDPAPSTQAGFQQLVAAVQTYDQHCQAMSGPLLPFVGTVNAARDMDEIRAAVGDAKLTYLGFSYGTFLGATYADLFPGHIRAMVLDGALNPALDPIANNIEQGVGLDQDLNAFFADCSSNGICPWRPSGGLRAAYDALIAGIAVHPLPAGNGRTLGPGEAFFGVAHELYDQASWPDLAAGLSRASAGDGSLLLQYSDQYTQRFPSGAYSNLLEANNAVNCVDAPWPRDPAVVQRAAPTAKQRAPEFGVADLYGGLTCTYWPAPPTSQPHAIAAPGSPPIVVVGTTGDPVTPYVDAQAVAGQLQHGVLLTRVGYGHSGYLFSACIRSHVDAYLVNLTVPAAGVTCPTP
ncbi:MAG: alpha/beta hydrolase [Actinomycetota bacterium]|nr:alpha/beta hydrolase [Actinomycetota bacterium]